MLSSRGPHIEGVSHVVNYDLPEDSEDYVHRIGRTARAGATGKAISLADEQGVLSLEAIETFIGHPAFPPPGPRTISLNTAFKPGVKPRRPSKEAIAGCRPDRAKTRRRPRRRR
ncbi:MAG: hypothetical protein MZU95_07865 [Desulfomicrobium escambiense]|nr:hypothetical protein [Desulfomicrobium escambiense]